MLKDFLLTFIPLFVAIDALGTLPIYISLTNRLEESEKRTLVKHACLTALIFALVFIFSGRIIFDFIGITTDDFRIGGGLLLIVIAMNDLISSNPKKERKSTAELAIVPLGIPLILGPASLTTIIMLTDKFGYLLATISTLLNLLIVWLMFRYSEWPLKIMGKGGAMAIGKIASLFLLAIAIMMIRVGLTNTFPILTR